ncbi:cyclin PCL2 [Lachancea thermotolerans CBS 6340]|uniref:KLTH0A05346p n=1 Tax=Lachancea thermotolerans (strain ATCC 56472 / CBS 6340 / NRRL Y-8284) TaxID=559295 RepID=C5DBU1_LACTC|nr:KLTH0A05346p [Lachancea thermotolerans CBS 6340]CAR21248.1 KLTH0A05346p [Lachancea thermotolerans CBS 6340]
MSDLEALLQFNKRRVSMEMIEFLASTSNSVIQVRTGESSAKVVSLVDFIKGLVVQSNVQTPTLMSTAVYLSKLRSIIPANVHGMETTRHRVFLGCLIIAAKNLNDSSPMNKHWASYTNGLLNTREVNTIERELLEYFDWNLRISTQDLVTCLSPFLTPIKDQLVSQKEDYLFFNSPVPSRSRLAAYHDSHSRSSSAMSIPSLVSSATMSTISTGGSRRTPLLPHSNSSNIHRIDENSYTYQSTKPVPGYAAPSLAKRSPSRPEKSHLARPIIMKTGLPGSTQSVSSQNKFGIKSNWASIFK